MILHDWPTKEAQTILSKLVPALSVGSRILIMDTVLPDSGHISATQERLLRVRDLTMMQVFNSHERAIEDWSTLLEQVDARLRLIRVHQGFGSSMAILEVVLDTDHSHSVSA